MNLCPKPTTLFPVWIAEMKKDTTLAYLLFLLLVLVQVPDLHSTSDNDVLKVENVRHSTTAKVVNATNTGPHSLPSKSLMTAQENDSLLEQSWMTSSSTSPLPSTNIHKSHSISTSSLLVNTGMGILPEASKESNRRTKLSSKEAHFHANKPIYEENGQVSPMQGGMPSFLLQPELKRSWKRQTSESETEAENRENLNNLNSQQHVLRLDRDYTPTEIADYIYSTGDEKGIVQAVSEMLQDGQIMESTDDVIVFLEMVQVELERLRKENNTRK